MARVIAVASGKGGVGKTTLTANLGVAMAKLGKRVLMIDTDMQMANLGLVLGMEGRPITLQDVLLGEASVRDAVYDAPGGSKFIPSGLSIEKFKRVDEEKIVDIVKDVSKDFDVILLDTAAGIGPDVLATLHAAEELLVCTMAESIAVADSFKVILVGERRLGMKIIGVTVDMVKGMKQEMQPKEIQKTLQTDILAIVPEDPHMRECSLEGVPVVIKYPTAPSAVAITNLAARLLGVAPPVIVEAKKKSSIEEFIEQLMAILGLKPKKKEGAERLGELTGSAEKKA
jgi:septum site-determining protein MinD